MGDLGCPFLILLVSKVAQKPRTSSLAVVRLVTYSPQSLCDSSPKLGEGAEGGRGLSPICPINLIRPIKTQVSFLIPMGVEMGCEK